MANNEGETTIKREYLQLSTREANVPKFRGHRLAHEKWSNEGPSLAEWFKALENYHTAVKIPVTDRDRIEDAYQFLDPKLGNAYSIFFTDDTLSSCTNWNEFKELASAYFQTKSSRRSLEACSNSWKIRWEPEEHASTFGLKVETVFRDIKDALGSDLDSMTGTQVLNFLKAGIIYDNLKPRMKEKFQKEFDVSKAATIQFQRVAAQFPSNDDTRPPSNNKSVRTATSQMPPKRQDYQRKPNHARSADSCERTPPQHQSNSKDTYERKPYKINGSKPSNENHSQKFDQKQQICLNCRRQGHSHRDCQNSSFCPVCKIQGHSANYKGICSRSQNKREHGNANQNGSSQRSNYVRYTDAEEHYHSNAQENSTIQNQNFRQSQPPYGET